MIGPVNYRIWLLSCFTMNIQVCVPALANPKCSPVSLKGVKVCEWRWLSYWWQIEKFLIWWSRLKSDPLPICQRSAKKRNVWVSQELFALLDKVSESNLFSSCLFCHNVCFVNWWVMLLTTMMELKCTAIRGLNDCAFCLPPSQFLITFLMTTASHLLQQDDSKNVAWYMNL